MFYSLRILRNSILVTSLVMRVKRVKPKRDLLYIRNQSVPRSRHSPQRRYKTSQLTIYKAKFAVF
jgi:hypothetical protein